VTQSYPIDVSREIDRRWKRRFHAARMRPARNDDHAGSCVCPICRRPMSIGSIGPSAPARLTRGHQLCDGNHERLTDLHSLA